MCVFFKTTERQRMAATTVPRNAKKARTTVYIPLFGPETMTNNDEWTATNDASQRHLHHYVNASTRVDHHHTDLTNERTNVGAEGSGRRRGRDDDDVDELAHVPHAYTSIFTIFNLLFHCFGSRLCLYFISLVLFITLSRFGPCVTRAVTYPVALLPLTDIYTFRFLSITSVTALSLRKYQHAADISLPVSVTHSGHGRCHGRCRRLQTCRRFALRQS